MRWNRQTPPFKYTRIIKKFLWWPKLLPTIDGYRLCSLHHDYETRWLEIAYIGQRRKSNDLEEWIDEYWENA